MIDDGLLPLNVELPAGLVLCLFWNLIAVTSAWIKGEGMSRLFHPRCHRVVGLLPTLITFIR